MDDIRVEMAVRLTEERVRLGYSQADFARALDISRERLRLYETGQSGIAAEILARALGLGADAQYILGGQRRRVEATAPAQPLVNVGSNSGALVGVVQAGASVTQINTQRHVTRTVAITKPGDEHITVEQGAALTSLVNQIVELEAKLKKKPRSYRAVWGGLNARFKVTSKALIRREDFEAARKHLSETIGRLNSMATAPLVDADGWRKRRYAYIKINAREDPAAVDAYMSRNFGRTSLADLSNDELERVYRYVAGRNSKRRPTSS